MFKKILPALVFLILLFVGCGSSNPAPEPPGSPPRDDGAGPGVAEPYVAKGRVTDSHGNPLEGIRVFANNTAYYNMNIFGITGADGLYRIELGDVLPSSWLVGAYLDVEYHGDTFSYTLQPDVESAFAGVTGAIRNLEWRLTGESPEGGHHGGLVHVRDDDYVVDLELVELTLTPVGQLIDGSPGSVITGFPERGFELVDVPVGNYRTTARYFPESGPAVDLLIRERDAGDYAPSVTAPLRSNLYLGPILSLEVRLP